jgi:hypothetical protein
LTAKSSSHKLFFQHSNFNIEILPHKKYNDHVSHKQVYKMKKGFIALSLIVSIFLTGIAHGQQQNVEIPRQLPPLQGNVQENSFVEGQHGTIDSPTGYIKDYITGKPLAGAEVSIPDKGITTHSKADGSFKLDLKGQQGNFIVSVKKDGYLPFALNAQKDDLSSPFTLFVQKNRGELIIDNDLHHLGDNNFSDLSANAGAFKMPTEGPVFIKEFYIEGLPANGMVLTIGSIIGLDTIASKELGQTNIDSFSSPLSIYVNSVKIAEIGVNSDNKTIPIPKTVLKPRSTNLLVLQTGVNQVLQYQGSIDYDDIEFMHLILQEK